MRALRASLAILLLLAWTELASAASSPRYHTVASGQRLGSIAKRYGVTVDAMCTANGIDRTDRLKVGQKLLVPIKGDKDGTITRRQYGPAETKDARRTSAAQTMLASTREPPRPTTHKVYSGQRLESIARRYQVSIEALCEANRIRRTDKIKPGQVLVIPGSLPDAGLSKLDDASAKRPSSTKATKRGFVEMATYTTRYRGVVFDKRGKVAPGAIESISKLFGATGSRPRVDARLIALLADVSEHFGRPLRIVSGWRDHSYFEDSRHKHSQAVDFSIPGVDNTVVRDYLRRFRNCGVGYYPNSSFVHLDVRDTAAYWVDYAGPGEAPRSKPRPDPKRAVAQADDKAGKPEESGGSLDAHDHPAAPAATPPAPVVRSVDITSGASRRAAVTKSLPAAVAPVVPGPSPDMP